MNLKTYSEIDCAHCIYYNWEKYSCLFNDLLKKTSLG